MKAYRIEKALVLGLLLSTSVYGASMAEDIVETNKQYSDQSIEADNIYLTYDENFTDTSPIWISGNVTATNEFTITNTKMDETKGKGINAYNGAVTVSAKKIEFNTWDDGIFTTGPQGEDISKGEKPDVVVKDFDSLNITSTHGFGVINNGNSMGSKWFPSTAKNKGDIYIMGNANSVITIQGGYKNDSDVKAAVKNGYYLDSSSKDYKTVVSGGIINLTGVGYGTWAHTGQVEVNGNDNKISAILDERFKDDYGKDAYNNFGIGVYNENASATTTITATGQNYIHGNREAATADGGTITIKGNSNAFDVSYDDKIVKESLKSDVADIDRYALHTAADKALIDVDATGTNTITSIQQGIYAEKGTVDITGVSNSIEAGGLIRDEENEKIWYGTDLAINAGSIDDKDDDKIYSGTVNLSATDGDNSLKGAVYAIGKDTTVDINSLAKGNTQSRVYSAAIIDGAGDLQDEEKFEGKQVVSALYAEHGATINWSGKDNMFLSYADNTDKDMLERTVWAYDGATINIDGKTVIRTNRYKTSPNNLDVAIAAGTGTHLKPEDISSPDNVDKTKVNITYDEDSYIEGDILSAYTGNVTIAAKEGATNASMHITGNLLSGNNGIMTVDLGNGGTLSGRVDDYGDAGTDGLDSEHTTFFNPTFSSTIYQGGEVNLKMGEDSYWQVTGQSWVTSVDTGTSKNVVIDLASAKSDLNANVQALTIGEMKGNAIFSMRLDGDRKVSDMLYMKKADGEYFIDLENPVTVEEMYQDDFNGLRFATVGKDSNVSFKAGTYAKGVFNIEYEVGSDMYANNTENDAYNSTSGRGEMDAAKPGSDLVDNFFGSEETETPVEEQASSKRMRRAAMLYRETMPLAEENVDDAVKEDTNLNFDGVTNYKLIGRTEEVSNAGKTIIDMSKVNYSNAIYMDRLNKRMGEARYIDGDEGLWVRIRHDRIGRSDAFRSKNTMMELGYDKRVDDREDGEHRRGFAIDYMRGTTDYHNVAGDGDVRRGGVWFYDTWLGNKGHYSDYVLKFGRLSNDFDIYSELGEKITGDYSNFVYSASAEYGRKKDIGKDWYFEPQVQLQYAHVTDADYTTSQGTSVELDAIDSLIGRVGFRLGKDMGENNTFYVKADVLHEFLGDQDISAFDDTGRLDTTYENEGTWYDVGLGFSHQFSKGTYMFLDVEKTFGNDNEDTYQFNVGMNWKV